MQYSGIVQRNRDSSHQGRRAQLNCGIWSHLIYFMVMIRLLALCGIWYVHRDLVLNEIPKKYAPKRRIFTWVIASSFKREESVGLARLYFGATLSDWCSRTLSIFTFTLQDSWNKLCHSCRRKGEDRGEGSLLVFLVQCSMAANNLNLRRAKVMEFVAILCVLLIFTGSHESNFLSSSRVISTAGYKNPERGLFNCG